MNLDLALSYAAGCVHGAEGYKSVAYLDTLAKPPVWTIGFGTTRINGVPVHQGMTCTREQALAWCSADMRSAAQYVLAKVGVPLNEWQLAALTSFCYNIGDGHFNHSTVLAALDAGGYFQAADRLLDYDEAGGHVYEGLETRRKRERALFLIGLGATNVPPFTKIMTDRLTPPPAAPPPAPEPDPDNPADLLNQAELNRLNQQGASS
jgi:lysozyme